MANTNTNTSNSLGDYLAELGVDINNMQSFLLNLSKLLSTSSDSVTIDQTLQDGTTTSFIVPSFGYLNGRVNNIENRFNSLLSGNANEIAVLDAAGNLQTFELKDISNVINEFESINNSAVSLPGNFGYRTNWFFDSFLNPLLYITVDTATIISNTDVNSFESTRLIITSQIQSDIDYFDTVYKGQTNLNYTAVINDLNNRGISYYTDTKVISLNPSQNKVRGTFDITAILEDSSSQVIGGQTLTTALRKYKLNTVRYTQLTANGSVDKTLQVGDILISSNNTQFKITSIDVNQRTVTLTVLFGTQGLSQGAGVLSIQPVLQRDTTIQINLGYNERTIVFLTPISDRLSLTTDKYSQGFAIFSNELTISMNNGTQLTLDNFYQNFVSDFGLLFTNYAKEKKIPSVAGQIPNKVNISSSNFEVIQIDENITDTDTTSAIKQKIAAKEQAAAQISALDQQISSTRANLNTNSALNEAQKLKLQKDLSTFADQRSTLVKTQQSLITDITTSIKSNPSFITNPEYAVRGFWAIPEPAISGTSTQNVVQFLVSWRSLSQTGNPKSPNQLDYTDNNGNSVTGSFSPWTEFLTKPRTKTYNSTTGFYEWADENVSDPNIVNSNQLSIPIKKGQIIEIRIKSLSEAGWPDNPVSSDWSSSVQVEFPASIQTIEDSTIVSQQAFADETRLSFQEELTAQGLDIHLANSFTSRDKYYAHSASDIASGFFATDGSIIDLYTELKSLSDTLASIQTSLSTAQGQLSVTLIDSAGNQRSITNGQTINVFAGYYLDYIKDTSTTPTTYKHGSIVNLQYLLQVQNTSQTPLQLIATLNGGIAQPAPTSNPIANPTVGYHTTLRYDLAPININNTIDSLVNTISEKDGYQSSQVKSQWAFARYSDVSVSTQLYSNIPDSSVLSSYSETVPYNYLGYTVNSSGTLVPYAAGNYLPYDPTVNSLLITIANSGYGLSTNSNVWNGTYSNGAVGGGLLSEFCIHTGHPAITDNWSKIKMTAYPNSDLSSIKQQYLPFSQGVHFEVSEGDITGVLGASYYQQAQYRQPVKLTVNQLGTSNSSSLLEANYPIKNGFASGDEYLIGKYTCGAYLTLNPSSYSSISVNGLSATGSTTSLAYGPGSAINIPITFQFRASDKLGFIGGWRADLNGGLKNVKYTKKIGIDIYTSSTILSFDLSFSGQYQKETAVVAPLTALSQAGINS